MWKWSVRLVKWSVRLVKVSLQELQKNNILNIL